MILDTVYRREGRKPFVARVAGEGCEFELFLCEIQECLTGVVCFGELERLRLITETETNHSPLLRYDGETPLMMT